MPPPGERRHTRLTLRLLLLDLLIAATALAAVAIARSF
jgi:hypothetical protein